MDVIREREECVAGTRQAIELPCVFRALLGGKRCGYLPFLEQALPLRLLSALEHLPTDKEVDRVGLFGTLDALFERQREDARMVAQPPVVRFGARESRAVDARLLARAQSDDRAAIGVRYAVRLGVL